MSEPMDIAMRLLKAPYDVYSHEGYKKEPFEGTLYAGGDVADTPRYYTPSLEGALDYAVYGSATGDVPMRGTSPAIRVVQDPGFDEKGQPAGRLIADSQLGDAYMQDDDSPLQSELMDDDTLRQLISQMPDKSPKSDTTGYYHSQQDRNKHIQGALERLKNKTSGRLDLTDSEKEIGGISTGRHDELDMMDFDDINSGWDFLEDWERRWLLNNRFDELPMWVQEQYRDDVRTGEPMNIAWRLLKTIEEGYHPELGSFLTNPLDDMYVDMTSMYGNHPQYEGMSGTEMHEDMDRQIRERLDSQGHDPNLFDMWINEGGEHYGNIDEEQKSALKQTMLDIMEEHGGKTIHHDNFEEKNAGEPMDIAMRLLKYQDYEILEDDTDPGEQRYTNLKVSPLSAFDHHLNYPIEGSKSEAEGIRDAIDSPTEQAILDATRQSLDEQGQVDFDNRIDFDGWTQDPERPPYSDKVFRRHQISHEGTSTIMPHEMRDSYNEKNLPPITPYESKPEGYWPGGIYPYDDPSTWYDDEEDEINPLERLQRISDMGIQGAKDFEQKNASEPMDLAYDAIRKNLNRWFKEKWVDVSRKNKDGKHPPCGRSKAKKGSKGYPKCRPSVKVSSKTPKTSGSMSQGQKQAATKRKRAKKQGVGGKPTIVKGDSMTAFNNAWNFLKALPEQQMFVERTRRQSLDGSEDEDFAQDHLPEIDRYGARSMGTVHPAILGMLQRRTDDYHQTKGISPDLNLDSGKEDDRRMHPEVTRYQPEQMERAGMSIAQGPDYTEDCMTTINTMNRPESNMKTLITILTCLQKMGHLTLDATIGEYD